jgi:hypothetical protein
MPVLFRVLGEEEWREAVTENVSRSGVLVRAEKALPERAAVEIRMALPSQIPGTRGANIICHAQVVRTVEPAPIQSGPNHDPLAPSGAEGRPGYAATICEYSLTPGFGK